MKNSYMQMVFMLLAHWFVMSLVLATMVYVALHRVLSYDTAYLKIFWYIFCYGASFFWIAINMSLRSLPWLVLYSKFVVSGYDLDVAISKAYEMDRPMAPKFLLRLFKNKIIFVLSSEYLLRNKLF